MSFNHDIFCKTSEENFSINLYKLSVYAFIVSLVIALLCIDHAIGYSDAQMENSSSKKDTIRVYGCDMFPHKAHCEPVHNKFDSFEIGNVSSLAYTATNDKPLIVQGKIG